MAVEIASGVTVDPEVRAGKPVVKGTRVPVALVVGQLAGGMAAEEYGISIEDVRAALSYAASGVANEDILLTD